MNIIPITVHNQKVYTKDLTQFVLGGRVPGQHLVNRGRQIPQWRGEQPQGSPEILQLQLRIHRQELPISRERRRINAQERLRGARRMMKFPKNRKTHLFVVEKS